MTPSEGISVRPQAVAEFDDWPSGIAVSRSGRTFVSFPRLDPQRAPATLVELIGGRAVPFPDDLVNAIDGSDPRHRFVSVHGITIGPGNRLLALDTGAHSTAGGDPTAAKLWVIDLDTNAIAHGIGFGHDVCLPTSYFNDVVIDYNRGVAGTAFISDSGTLGPNGIVVVDLDSGASRRRLNGHASVRVSVPAGFGIATEAGIVAAPPTVDGLALSPDDGTLWWTPLGAYDFFSIDTDILADGTLEDDVVERHVVAHDRRDFASDGLTCDRQGRVYFTDITNGTVQRYLPAERRYEKLLGGERSFHWPDAVWIAQDRQIFVSDSQLDLAPAYNGGVDARERPFRVYRAAIDADPAQY